MSLVTVFGPTIQTLPDTSANYDLAGVERVEARLRRSGYCALRKIGCDTVRGRLILWGSVPSYYLKQMAQELAGEVVGLQNVKNRIQVRLNATTRY